MRLYRITAPHYVAGIECYPDGAIRRTAPILAWCKSRGLKASLAYFKRKNYGVEELPPREGKECES